MDIFHPISRYLPKIKYENLFWDSEFFGLQIARVVVPQWSAEIANEIQQWQTDQKIKCLYILAKIDDYYASEFIPKIGGVCVDQRINFEKSLLDLLDEDPLPVLLTIRPAILEDVSVLKEIASYSYFDTRFYFDPHFPRVKCGELYQLWVERSCQKIIADEVLVALEDGHPVGYITCVVKNGIGTIGLVGVSKDGRGKGIGRQLVLHALKFFKQNGCVSAHVATQGRNILAQRVYQRAGFLTSNVSLWYHIWS